MRAVRTVVSRSSTNHADYRDGLVNAADCPFGQEARDRADGSWCRQPDFPAPRSFKRGTDRSSQNFSARPLMVHSDPRTAGQSLNECPLRRMHICLSQRKTRTSEMTDFCRRQAKHEGSHSSRWMRHPQRRGRPSLRGKNVARTICQLRGSIHRRPRDGPG
jgi:hypothetical protein